jgi:hypothetical protein
MTTLATVVGLGPLELLIPAVLIAGLVLLVVRLSKAPKRRP